MKLISFLSRHRWTVAGLALMALVPLWVIQNDRQEAEERLAKELEWVEWYPGVLELNRKRGKVVWMHFHAPWDLSGEINKQRVLQDSELVDELKRQDVVLVSVNCKFPGCLQSESPTFAELKRMGGFTVPFDLIAPRNQSDPLIKLPEVLEPGDVREALRLAAN